MNLEIFSSSNKKGKSTRNFLRNTLGLIKSKEELTNKEIFNNDGSRKWIFYKWQWGENEQSGQLNAALAVKISNGWSTLMKGMMRWENDTEPIYGLEISGVTEDGLEKIYYFDEKTGGKKRFSGTTTSIVGVYGDEARSLLLKDGIKKDQDLPEFVDFEKTVTLFLEQAKNLDFSNPKIIEKGLLE